jgi:hypothetical protein
MSPVTIYTLNTYNLVMMLPNDLVKEHLSILITVHKVELDLQ